jgi:hypothetical protein
MVLAESGLFDLINGLPQHPLVVHAVVVLLPLLALLSVLIAWKPRWDRAWGVWVVAGLFVITGVTFAAKESGEALARRIGQGAITATGHLSLGTTLPIFAGVLFVLTGLMWSLDRRTGLNGVRTTLTKVVAVLVIVAAVSAVVETVRVGESGARAVWGYVQDQPPRG